MCVCVCMSVERGHITVYNVYLPVTIETVMLSKLSETKGGPDSIHEITFDIEIIYNITISVG